MPRGEPPPGDRPRWAFTWLLRIERLGRNRRERPADNGEHLDTEGRLRRWAIIVVVAMLLIEIAVGVWLGYLPR